MFLGVGPVVQGTGAVYIKGACACHKTDTLSSAMYLVFWPNSVESTNGNIGILPVVCYMPLLKSAFTSFLDDNQQNREL